jgi:hypothetical protein
MKQRSRLILGVVLGAATFTAYTLVAQYVNAWALPGLPLYVPPPGRVGAVLLALLFGALLGALAAWPEDAIPGVLLATLAGALASAIFILLDYAGSDQLAGATVIVIFTLLPRTMLFVPMAALVRWAMGVFGEELRQVDFSLRRLGATLLLLLALSAGAGYFSIYPEAGRAALQITHQLVQSGLAASNQDTLPAPLQDVTGFRQSARGAYTLELSNDPDLLPIQRPIAPYGTDEYAVFVRFDNGFRFGCVFTPSNAALCGNY